MSTIFLGWYDPLSWKRSTYNSVLLLLGAIFVANSLTQFIGIVLIGEAFLVTIEGCWTKGADQ